MWFFTKNNFQRRITQPHIASSAIWGIEQKKMGHVGPVINECRLTIFHKEEIREQTHFEPFQQSCQLHQH